jgi:hypothetical protein
MLHLKQHTAEERACGFGILGASFRKLRDKLRTGAEKTRKMTLLFNKDKKSVKA